MLLFVSSSLIVALSMSLILAASPLSMGLWVLLIALSCSLFSGLMFNSWFAIIIFLIYIGGMLVMFAYFTALTPNQPLGLNLMFSMFLLTFLLTLFLSTALYSSGPMIMDLTPHLMNASITILYSPFNTLILIILATILFFILVAVVKIVNINSGPLRPFN